MDSKVRVALHNSQNANIISANAEFYANGTTASLQNPQPTAGGFVKVHANAKINLFLDVLGKRADGYHNIFTVMQSINLYDDLIIRKINNNDSSDEPFTLKINKSSNYSLPTDETNLVTKAAKFLIKEYKIKHPIHIELTKRIPMGAGLGGGSSDCAATLRGINELFSLNIPLNELLEIGRTFGADVPFCIMGGTALAEGIGERLTPIQSPISYPIVLIYPNIHVSTKNAYALLSDYTPLPDSKRDEFITACKTCNIATLSGKLYNAFTAPLSIYHPQIANFIDILYSNGALGASMSGSGSAIFGIFKNKILAQRVCDILGELT